LQQRHAASKPEKPANRQRARLHPGRMMEKKLKQERWRILQDFPRYAVSDRGRVRIAAGPDGKPGQILKPYRASSHGIAVRIRRKDGTTWKPMVRLLVAMAWLPPSLGRRWVLHKNSNWRDCSAANLEWSSSPPVWFGRPQGAKGKKRAAGTIPEQSKETCDLLFGARSASGSREV